MKWTVFLLALVVGLALAEEKSEKSVAEAEKKEVDSRAFDPFTLFLKAVLAPLFAPAKVLVNLGLEVVVTIALILLIAQLVKELDLGALLGETGTGSGYESGYGYPAATGYESYGGSVGGSASGGSSYTSTGHSHGGSSYTKRAAVDTSFFNLPIVQRLTARVHEAIDSFNP